MKKEVEMKSKWGLMDEMGRRKETTTGVRVERMNNNNDNNNIQLETTSQRNERGFVLYATRPQVTGHRIEGHQMGGCLKRVCMRLGSIRGR